jgi:restriction system protein
MGAMGTVLRNGIEVDHVVDWELLKNASAFSVPHPTKPKGFALPPEPAPTPSVPNLPLSWWHMLIPALRRRNEALMNERRRLATTQRQQVLDNWKEALAKVENANIGLAEAYKWECATWQSKKAEYLAAQQHQHAAIDEQRQSYFANDPVALNDYWNIVLSQSEYPDTFPKAFSFDYLPESTLLILEYSLPNISSLPQVKEVKFVATRSEFQEVPVSATWLNRTYDSVLYQIALRTIYELFQSDAVNALKTVVFNGWVDAIEKATGKEVTNCVLSVQAEKAEFMDINLAQVDPRACFKKLRGVSGGKLVDLSPVRPVLQLNKDDKRFVASHDVANALDDSYNLAAMDWLDFENLIREVFEKEFSSGGGEVKITRASRDGGVDAVAFDPDPIRGGKIVIQAKRYTNTVGVSAVRDLYGTVLNEGATKGILVTTADYGPDSYEFAKDKPLTLLSGSELLYLLQKHGHRARIDLAEAKRLGETTNTQFIPPPTVQ